MLQVIDIYKQYEHSALLKGVSFTVERGEVLCLLGPSGSGKSTLLRIISGLEQPDRGSVLWEANDLANVPVHHRRFSLMFQEYALFPHRTVFENVAFGLKMQKIGKKEIAERVLERLDSVQMRDKADRKVTDLSGGEQQRVAFARALAPDPRLLMLDEPLGALDRTLREMLMDDLHELLKVSGVPTIYVTHDQQEAFALADRIILLNEGIIVQSGTPEVVYHQPVNPWVARFLGFKNFLPGEVMTVSPFCVKTRLGILQVGGKDSGCSWRSGDRVTLLVRPQGARLSDEKQGENIVEGTCEDLIFQGAEYRIRVKLENDLEFELLMPQPVDLHQHIRLSLPQDQILCMYNGEK